MMIDEAIKKANYIKRGLWKEFIRSLPDFCSRLEGQYSHHLWKAIGAGSLLNMIQVQLEYKNYPWRHKFPAHIYVYRC